MKMAEPITRKYKKKYTEKEWKRFSWDMQERLCARYTVLLPDYTTTREKLANLWKKIKLVNLDNELDKVSKGIEEFSKVTKSFSVGIPQREYDELIGKPKKAKKKKKTKRKTKKKDSIELMGKRDYSFLTGRRKKVRIL